MRQQWPRGTAVDNNRQLEQLADIAQALEISSVTAGWQGAIVIGHRRSNLITARYPEELPPAIRRMFSFGDANRGSGKCTLPLPGRSD